MDITQNPDDYKEDTNQDIEFKISEVASTIGESRNVVNNWFKDLREYIPHHKNKSGYNIFRKEGLERFKEIQKLHREQNWSMKQIGVYFATGGEAFKIESEPSSGEVIANELKAMREEIELLRKQNEQQQEFNKYLVKKLDEQQQKENERDNRLMETIRAIQQEKEEIKQIAVSKEESKNNKKGFFARLFEK